MSLFFSFMLLSACQLICFKTVNAIEADNIFFIEVAVHDKLLEDSFAQQSGNKNGKFKVAYGSENVKIDSDVNIDLAGPLIYASAALGYQGWLAGYQTASDTQATKLNSNNFALGDTTKDFVLHTAANRGERKGFLGLNHVSQMNNIKFKKQTDYK